MRCPAQSVQSSRLQARRRVLRAQANAVKAGFFTIKTAAFALAAAGIGHALGFATWEQLQTTVWLTIAFAVVWDVAQTLHRDRELREAKERLAAMEGEDRSERLQLARPTRSCQRFTLK